MGNICNCMKLQPELSNESAPLIIRDTEQKSNQIDNERGAKYYQAIIDDAHKKFISSSNRHRVTMGTGVEELRSKLLNITIDPSLINNTAFRPTSPIASTANTSSSSAVMNRNNRVVDILSEPIIDITKIDIVVDEIAELILNRTFNFRMEDTFNSTVVSFKPVVGTISSTN